MSDSQNNAGSTAPAAKKRTGLTVLLYILLFVAIGASLWAMSLMRKVESIPTIQRAVGIFPQLEEMKDLTQSQIQQRAEATSASDVLDNPHPLAGRFVVVDGEVQGEESTMVNQNMQAANMTVEAFEGDGYKSYVLDDGLVLVDISGEKSQFVGGDLVRGFGMLLVVDIKDIWELPFVGPDLKKEFGDVEGTAQQVIFLFSKGVKKISESEMTPSKAGVASIGEAATVENPCALVDHANPCTAGENPCAADGEAGGEAANPCADGENPCAGAGDGANPCNPCGGGGEAAPGGGA